MKDRQVSTNFKLSEFIISESFEHIHKSKAIDIVTMLPFQIYLVEQLAQNLLQPIRDEFGPLQITSSYRNDQIFNAMKLTGYKPSPTTDHSFGDQLVNWKGSGAADIVPLDAHIQDVFDWVISMNLRCNQIIMYPDKGFIHIANPKHALFNGKLVEKLNLVSRKPRAIYEDGKYTPYDRN